MCAGREGRRAREGEPMSVRLSASPRRAWLCAWSVGLAVMLLAALVPSLYLLARHGSAARKMGIPFAPFLALGSIVALFAGEAILDAYLGLL